MGGFYEQRAIVFAKSAKLQICKGYDVSIPN